MFRWFKKSANRFSKAPWSNDQWRVNDKKKTPEQESCCSYGLNDNYSNDLLCDPCYKKMSMVYNSQWHKHSIKFDECLKVDDLIFDEGDTTIEDVRRQLSPLYDCAYLNYVPEDRYRVALLMIGIPGTGKTALMRAMFAELKNSDTPVNFILISGDAIKSRWVGGSEKLLASACQYGRVTGPSIIFMDEVDAVAGSKQADGKEDGNNGIVAKAMLDIVDGFKPISKLLGFVLATNNPDRLPDNILRRFKIMHVAPPTQVETSRKILEACWKAHTVDFSEKEWLDAAEYVQGWAPAYVTELAREAKLLKQQELERCRDFIEVSSKAADGSVALGYRGLLTAQDKKAALRRGHPIIKTSLDKLNKEGKTVVIPGIAKRHWETASSAFAYDKEEHMKNLKPFLQKWGMYYYN